MNIGIIDHTLGPPIDTLLSLEPDSPISLDMNNVISGPGEYSFALGVIDSNDHVSFYSNEVVYAHGSGYTPYPSFWPSLSFTPSLDSVNVVLSVPPDDSTIVLNSTSGDSVLFEWRFSHAVEVDVESYLLRIGLPYPSNMRNMDTLFIEASVSENKVSISKHDLLNMLVEANLSEGVFEWDVTGTLSTGEMVAVASHSFSTVMDDPNYLSLIHI